MVTFLENGKIREKGPKSTGRYPAPGRKMEENSLVNITGRKPNREG